MPFAFSVMLWTFIERERLYMGEYIAVVTMSALFVTLFLGGWPSSRGS